MAVAAVLAAALTDHSAKARGLFIAGLDVLSEPGSKRFGVDPTSISITENGPGGVSEMSFDLKDPARQITLSDGSEVRYQDLGRDFPIFLGTIDAAPAEPAFGQQGRIFHVRCTGVEATLDWRSFGVDITFAAGTKLVDAIQSLAAQSIGQTVPLRAFSSAAGFSTIATPIAADVPDAGFAAAVTITAGTTLREAIRQVVAAGPATAGEFNVTVDFYAGLRVWSASPPSDYVGLTIDETTAGGHLIVENLSYGIDAAAVRQVIVRNGASINIPVSDGTGKPGQTAVLTDPNIATAAAAQAAGLAYLAANATTASGSFQLLDATPPNATAPGTPVGTRVTIALSTGLGITATAVGPIQSITKTFNESDRENWTVAFGGPAPRASQLIRRLTRSTISA